METISALHLQLTTPVQPLPLCSRKGVAHHHAYTKTWSLVHRWTYTASADKHTESWDSSKQSGITVLRNSDSPLLVLVKTKRDAQAACMSGQKGAEWQCHGNFFISLEGHLERGVSPKRVCQHLQGCAEGCDEGELLGEETGLQLLWLDCSWWQMHTGQENVSVYRQNLCANLEKRPWEDWCGSHQGTHPSARSSEDWSQIP